VGNLLKTTGEGNPTNTSEACDSWGDSPSVYNSLVVELYPSEKYESQMGLLFPIYGKI